MATPASRILVVYIADAAADGQASAAPLDAVTARGCSGFLILPENQDKLHALLGVDTEASERSGMFPYPTMPITVFSDSPAACESVKALGVSDVREISSREPHDALAARVAYLLHLHDPKTKQLVLVHLAQYQADHWVFKLVEKLLGSKEAAASTNDCFVSIVRTAQRPHEISPELAAHPLRPRQSFERHHGKYADPGKPPLQRLLVSSFHSDRTRCDLATRFDEREIEALGAYGAMDARIFMKEMAFRLGFAPKYGA